MGHDPHLCLQRHRVLPDSDWVHPRFSLYVYGWSVGGEPVPPLQFLPKPLGNVSATGRFPVWAPQAVGKVGIHLPVAESILIWAHLENLSLLVLLVESRFLAPILVSKSLPRRGYGLLGMTKKE